MREQVLDALRPHLDPDRIVADETGIEQAAAVWNGAVRNRPAVVVRCRSVADVQHAVRAATAAGMPLSVRGGGHDWAGRAIRPDGLVVDLTGLRQVTIRAGADGESGVATVAGGATCVEVAEAAAPHGLALVSGTVGDVGLVGLSLGGGYGTLTGRFGLATDQLLAAEVVLADGRIVHTADDPELLWALRGGGGNFGVVTSVDVNLPPLREVVTGTLTFPAGQIAAVLGGLAALLRESPDELAVVTMILAGPDGEPVLNLAPTWSGSGAEARPWLDRLTALGTPATVEFTSMSPLAQLRLNDGMFDGLHWAIRCLDVAAYTPEVVTGLLDAFALRGSATAILNTHHFHGAATRVSGAESPFGNRRNHHMVEILEFWPPGDDAPPVFWSDRAAEVLAPHALPGGYPNMMRPGDLDRADAAYGSHGARLLAVKDRLDPDGVFTATPLPVRRPA